MGITCSKFHWDDFKTMEEVWDTNSIIDMCEIWSLKESSIFLCENIIRYQWNLYEVKSIQQTIC